MLRCTLDQALEPVARRRIATALAAPMRQLMLNERTPCHRHRSPPRIALRAV
jgi:hypothetical protein